MQLIKKLLAKYTAFIWSILRPLGSWGVFGVAFLDSAAYGIPLDPVVASYIYVRPAGIWLFAFMAAAGSALGSLVPYAIGRAGGELLQGVHHRRRAGAGSRRHCRCVPVGWHAIPPGG